MLKITLSTGEITEYECSIDDSLEHIKFQLMICSKTELFLKDPITIISYHYESETIS